MLLTCSNFHIIVMNDSYCQLRSITLKVVGMWMLFQLLQWSVYHIQPYQTGCYLQTSTRKVTHTTPSLFVSPHDESLIAKLAWVIQCTRQSLDFHQLASSVLDTFISRCQNVPFSKNTWHVLARINQVKMTLHYIARNKNYKNYIVH